MPSLAPDKRQVRRAGVATAVVTLLGIGFFTGLQIHPVGDADAPSAAPPAAAPAAATVAPAPAPAAPVTAPARAQGAELPVTTADASRYTPLYQQAARRFGVNWLLLASIHRQETAFSTAHGTYHGLNFAHCCAGPMQFNVKNGHPSTWERFRSGYKYAARPEAYPHATTQHPSVYDDFDSIMAAAWLLRANGAGRQLDSHAWSAAYMYYGPGDTAAVDYANAVLARATAWTQIGFVPDTPDDQALIAYFESSYGASIRSQIVADAVAAEKKRRDDARHQRELRRERRAAAKHDAKRRHHDRKKPAGATPPHHHAPAARPPKDSTPAKGPGSAPAPDVHTSTVPADPPPPTMTTPAPDPAPAP
jgi:hypothetical protein